jgi:hypothetical protein
MTFASLPGYAVAVISPGIRQWDIPTSESNAVLETWTRPDLWE